ncbi:hypothetical protein ACEV60_03305 [Enterobacter ludwigii]|uniref:tail fiber/spike domain-containing protein n=1 Tax=Enterobacter ludwigii TaxID=299767 RepID=UPI003BEEFABE
MATTPTNLPVPSESPRDLKFNAGKIDEFVTSLVNTYVDRFGNEHYTIEGLRWLAQQAIAQYGWILVDSFQDGAELTLPNQALRDENTGEYYRWDGALPKHVDAGSTPASSGGTGKGAWISVGDAALRSELHEPDGGALIGLGEGHTVADLIDTGISDGDALIPVIQPFPNAGLTNQHLKNAENLSVADWLAVDGVDSSSQAQKMIDDTGMLIVPERFTLVAKNLNLSSAKKVIVKGKLKLPSGCVDFDRLLYAAGNNSGLSIYINELDGNKTGQSGQIGTHLVYLTNCQNVDFFAHYVHDHYYPRTFTTASSPDGIRNDGTGCLFFYQCHYSKFIVDRIESWGHEAFYIYKTNRSIAALGHAQGSTLGDEYSGIQFSGDHNRLLYASVDKAGASSLSFDCRYSFAGKLISTNNRFFHGIGFGHAGLPTTNSVVESIFIDTTPQNGINFAAGTSGLRILSATVLNAGQYSVNQSDNAKDNSVSNFTFENPSVGQANSFQNNLILINGDMSVRGAGIPALTVNAGGTYTIRKVKISATDTLEINATNALAGNASATVSNGNITIYSHIIIYPANAAAAQANAYISTIANGSFTLATQSGNPAGSGANFRYMVL